MARTHDIAGLTERAEEFVKDLEEITSTRYVSCAFTGEEMYNLGTWITQDGTIIREVPQDERHCGGPVTFTCLKDDNGNRFYVWSEDQMDYY